MFPTLRGTHLGLSKRALSGWRVLRPAKSSAPFSKQICLALAFRLLTQSKTPAAVVLLLTFAGCLRISEAIAIRVENIAFPGDARLAAYGPRIAGINIRDAKTARYTGSLQFVRIDDDDVIKLTQAWASLMDRTSGSLVDLSYQTYAADLQAALASFGIHNAPFSSHSARIGKATEDFIAGVPVTQIALHGRALEVSQLPQILRDKWSRLAPGHEDPPGRSTAHRRRSGFRAHHHSHAPHQQRVILSSLPDPYFLQIAPSPSA